MKSDMQRLAVGVLWGLLGAAGCTCQASIGQLDPSDDDRPVVSGAAPTVTQHAPASDPAPAQLTAAGIAEPQAPPPTGQLSDASVRKTEARHHNELRFCMEQGAAAAESPQVRVQFVVKDDGSVADKVDVVERSHASDRLTTCLVQAVKRWKFEAPKGGPARATLLLKR